MSDFSRRTKTAYGTSGLILNESELQLINQYTLREYTIDELFAFQAIACDNEIDRDTEAFPAATLRQLAKLIVGKPIISDHCWSADEQCARIYTARVKTDSEKMTSYGEPYAKLVISCYLQRTPETQPLINQIESGMRKEVSIACNVEKNTCSICGHPYYSGDCMHSRGEIYDAKKCYVQLEGATDAYEVSFTAVPAQPGAGVTKGGEKQENTLKAEIEGITKMLKTLIASYDASGNNAKLSQEPPPNEAPKTEIDPEIEKLIKSADALATKYKGDYAG